LENETGARKPPEPDRSFFAAGQAARTLRGLMVKKHIIFSQNPMKRATFRC